MCYIVIEAKERPLGFLSNAVLTPEYSCTDIPLIEDSVSLIYDFEHCGSLRVCMCVCGRERRGKKKQERLCVCVSNRESRNIPHTCKSVLCVYCTYEAQHLALHRRWPTRAKSENDLSAMNST